MLKKRNIICITSIIMAFVCVCISANIKSNANSRKYVKKMNVYVSTSGNDKNTGASKDKAVKTLDRLVKVMKQNASKYDIETLNIYIAKGTYRNQNFNITFYPAKKINVIGEIDSAGNRAIFTTNGKHSVKGKRYFANIKNIDGNAYKISNITVSRYTNGIFFRGYNNDATQGGNWLENVNLYKIGDYYSFEKQYASENASENGYAAIEFSYCSKNVVRNCKVTYALNRTGNYIHGVYIANNSCDNRIYKSRFQNIKPDPIRIRNNSNNNRIYSNNFINTGVYAYVSEWHKPAAGEKVSYGNSVYRNKFYGKYNSGGKEFKKLDEIAIFLPATAKKANADSKRLKAYKNVFITSKKDKNYDKNTYIYAEN